MVPGKDCKYGLLFSLCEHELLNFFLPYFLPGALKALGVVKK